MKDYVSADLRVAHNGARADAVELAWIGKSADRYPGRELTPYLQAAIAEAAAQQLPIEMHFERLDHFNSSTITVIIQFIQEARQRGVRLLMVYNQALKWQKLSFDALRVFAKDSGFELRST